MKLIEHLEFVIRLVEGSAPYPEIKRSLLAMQEEVSGYEQTAADKVALDKKNQELVLENTNLKAEQPSAPGKLCPYCRKLMGDFLGNKPSHIMQEAMLGLERAYYKCSNPKCGKDFNEEIK